MSILVPNKVYLRGILLHYFIQKKSAAEAHRILVQTYGDNALSDTTCRDWFRSFKNNDFELEDKERSGAPKKFQDKELEQLLDEDPSQTLSELGKILQVDESTVLKRLKGLGMIQKQGHWVPYELKPRDVERRFGTCELLLQRQKRKGFLHRIVTGDEKHIHKAYLLHQSTVVVFIDIKSAFDNVLPPQGSVLSFMLFNIYLRIKTLKNYKTRRCRRLLELCDCATTLSQYAYQLKNFPTNFSNYIFSYVTFRDLISQAIFYTDGSKSEDGTSSALQFTLPRLICDDTNFEALYSDLFHIPKKHLNVDFESFIGRTSRDKGVYYFGNFYSENGKPWFHDSYLSHQSFKKQSLQFQFKFFRKIDNRRFFLLLRLLLPKPSSYNFLWSHHRILYLSTSYCTSKINIEQSIRSS
ncbi:MOS1T transposase, partial [Pseudoatta argentina]